MHCFFLNQYNKNSLKLGILGIAIFLVMGAYTIFKELKDSVFMIIVGAQYLPDVKAISLFLMIPMVILYSWLSERMRREHLLICCLLFYGIGGLLTTYLIQHPTIGLSNTVSSQFRFFGWFFYLFLEGCSPFLVSALWSFFNSISHPTDIKDSYIKMTVMSKTGGIVFSGLAYLYNTYYVVPILAAEVHQYAMIMGLASVAILCVPCLVVLLLLVVRKKDLIGYAEEAEAKGEKKKNSDSVHYTGFFGLSVLFKNYYIIGIFGMTFFWEVINVIFNNLRLNIAFSEAGSISGITAILYKNIFFMHLFGLFFVLFGTKNIINYLGQRIGLLLIPLLTGFSILLFLIYPTTNMIFITYLVIRAINYTLTFPLREALFIPTSREIQFQTKSWIDSFGQKFSKGCGSLYNKMIQLCAAGGSYHIQIVFFTCLISIWIVMNYYLGRKWNTIIKNKEIIS